MTFKDLKRKLEILEQGNHVQLDDEVYILVQDEEGWHPIPIPSFGVVAPSILISNEESKKDYKSLNPQIVFVKKK